MKNWTRFLPNKADRADKFSANFNARQILVITTEHGVGYIKLVQFFIVERVSKFGFLSFSLGMFLIVSQPT